jgi:hypothetical protein
MLKSVEAHYTSRTSILNALSVGIKALDDKADLDYPSGELVRALEASDYEQAIFAFDVLNKMCGDKLPPPSLVEPFDFATAAEPDAMTNSDGSELSYENKISLAADMVNALSRINLEIVQAYARAIVTAQMCGHTALLFIKALSLLYRPTP